MTKFDPTAPSTESRIQSEPIRRNFVALNERTDQLTPSVTDPVSTSLIIGRADKVYFEDNKFSPFNGATIDLGSSTTGVSSFNTPGTFKEIIIFYTLDTFGVGILSFIESVEKSIRDHSTATAASLITTLADQRQADTFGQSAPVPGFSLGISPLDNSIIICSIFVTNNGQTGVRGAITSIFESDLLDIRPFLQRTSNTKALEDHINAPTLAQAHPGSLITNSLIQTFSTIVTSTVSSNTIPVANTAPFDPTILGYQPFVRITSDAQTTEGTVFKTARVTSTVVGSLVLDHSVSVSLNDRVIRGVITLDKMSFDVVNELSDLFQRDSLTGAVEFDPLASISLTGVTATGGFTGNVTGTASGNPPNSRTISTTSPITGGGDLSSNRTIAIPQATTSVNGYLAAADFTTFNNKLNTSFSNVSGTLPILNGGTGATTANNAFNALAPSQATNANKVLVTNATDSSWSFIADANISSSAAIVDTKLATIATSGKVSNSATTATNVNTASAIVARDGSGNFSAGTITANLTGNASGTAANVTGTVAVANGGTGATTTLAARNNLGIYSGTATLASGAITLSSLPFNPNNYSITVTAITSDGPPSSNLYLLIVSASSFSINSDRGTDSRSINWIAISKL